MVQLQRPEPHIFSFRPSPRSEICLVRVSQIDDSYESELKEVDRERYASISHPQKRKEFLASRVALNRLCSDLQLTYERRRPLLRWGGHLSLTHAHHWAGCYYSPAHRVGIDIEGDRPKLIQLAPKFLNPEEISFAFADEDHLFRLQILWGAKEALFKLWGQRGVSFKENISIGKFKVRRAGSANAFIHFHDQLVRCEVHFRLIEDAFVVWALEIDD